MQPASQFQTISCQFIEFPDSFVRWLHEGPVDSTETDNLVRFGQTIPLLVRQQTKNRYLLLAGFSSFQAITAQKIYEALCHILPPDISPGLLYSLQILHSFDALQASPILQAHLLKLARQELTDKEILDLLSLMGHKPQRYKLNELTTLLELCPAAVMAIHRGLLSPKAGKMLHVLSHENQELLVRLLNMYRPGGSKQQKLVDMVVELFHRDNAVMRDRLQEWLATDRDVEEKNTPQRLQGILHTLHTLQSPEKSKMEREFQQFAHELLLPDGVSIMPSPSFEDDSVEMRLHFVNKEALKEQWGKIRQFLCNLETTT